MLPYTLRQLVWMLTSALQLIYALSTGIVWVMQMVRLFAYGACVGVCFIPHWWWYLTSPNIIRRVSYRSSDTTKRRNILRVLEAEGVDLHDVLRKTSTPPPPPPLPAGLRRRRLLVGPRGGAAVGKGSDDAGSLTDGSGRRRGVVRGQRGGSRPTPRRRPMSDAATVSASRCRAFVEDADGFPHTHGGEVVDAAQSQLTSHDAFYSGSSAISPLRRRRVPAGSAVSGGGQQPHAVATSGEFTHEGGSHNAIRRQHAQGMPKTGPPRRRPGPRPAGDAQTPTTLERLMGAAQVSLNPADGSELRSLPVRRTPATDATAGKGGRRADLRLSQHRQGPSISPHRSPIFNARTGQPLLADADPALGEVKQSSSSSCDVTLNRPENSSGDDDRGVGVGREMNTAAATAASRTPQLRNAEIPTARHHRGEEDDEEDDEFNETLVEDEEAGRAPLQAPVYEGRPVYYETLPKVEIPNDPLLKDVLAALQEGEEEEQQQRQRRREHDAVSRAGTAEGEEESGEDEAEGEDHVDDGHRFHPYEQQPQPQENHQRVSSESRRAAPGMETRRRATPSVENKRGGQHAMRRSPPQQQQQQQQVPKLPSPHTRTFSEENILAGLEDEDEEDKMNLHNRATVDIVLPVPLDSLMKTLEYTQHSKRLRRKRFPIIIDVTGAVWIIGSHLWSTMMARILAQRGYVVFCPDYRNFPQTTMEGMTLDVSDAIAWVLNNAERYNGDLSNVTLIGQSAGAHLTMMSLLSQAQLSAYRNNASSGRYENVPPPSDVAYNVPRYNPRESIHRYVGLSGMYNIEGLVDHFQNEGLNTPVLHQIAGGRDQLARYSIHAYFDDRRGGDTGERLPDNIFDYFPQRMFFVHGDADKCAPVTESASLVAILRSAQERFAARRNERNEEARRHALRSRRFLPGALSSNTGGADLSADYGGGIYSGVHNNNNTTNMGNAYRDGHASLSWAQRSAGEEDGNRRGNAVAYEHDDTNPAEEYRYASSSAFLHHGAGQPTSSSSLPFSHRNASGVGAQTPAPPPMATAAAGILNDTQARRSGAYWASGNPAGASVPAGDPSGPTIVSPIVPPSREDLPRSAVELEFIVIPNGRHSDAFVDECIAAGRSCCVDFLCDYESAVDFPSSSFSASQNRGLDGDSLCGSMPGIPVSPGHRSDHIPAWMAQSPQVCAMPDGILPLAVPTEDRSFPLRLCTLICPF